MRRNALVRRSYITGLCATGLLGVLALWNTQAARSQSSPKPSTGTVKKNPSRNSASNATAKSHSKPEPSLDETLDWLTNHLTAMQVYLTKQATRPYQDGSYEDVHEELRSSIGPVNLRSCNIVLNFSQENKETAVTHYATGRIGSSRVSLNTYSGTYSFSLGDVTDSHSDKTTVAEAPFFPSKGSFANGTYPVSMAVLNGRGSAFILRSASTSSISNPDSSTPSITNTSPFSASLSSLDLYSQDPEIAERVVRAFSNAAKLCRGKEAF